MTDRYARQIVLPEVGDEGQAALRAASVLVVGAGGLGCAVLPYLCGAGVGRIVVIDHDRVEEANLHRQTLYRTSEAGRHKADAAREVLVGLNPQVQVESVCEALTPANAARWVSEATLVVDAADSFAVTYTLSDTCAVAGRPLVSASVIGLSGFAGVFCGGAPSYRAVFPDMPTCAASCATAGVLGTAVGVLGTLQAHMVIAFLLGLQPSPLARVVSVDLRTLRFGGFEFESAPEPANVIPFIAPCDVRDTDVVVDLRAREEAPTSPFATALRLDADGVEHLAERVARSQRVVLCCRSGLRAWRAADRLRVRGHTNLALIGLGS